MSTKPRIIAPDLIYQVYSKGARNTAIFSSPQLKGFFLNELEKTLKRFSYQCYAWSVMDDHYHLVLKSSDVPVSLFMQRLNSVFARHFNQVRKESGVVFSKRFASLIVENTSLKELIRFVHLNPVRGKSCTIEQLDTYQWCGHQHLLNNNSECFQNTTDVLKCFSETDSSGAYGDYVRDGLSEGENSSLIKDIRNANRGVESFSKAGSWISGSGDFVTQTLERDRRGRARIARHIRENVTFEIIHEKVSTRLSVGQRELYCQGRGNVRTSARDLFAFIGKSHYEFTAVSISNYLGVSSSAVSKMISRYRLLYDKNKPVMDGIISKDSDTDRTGVSLVGA